MRRFDTLIVKVTHRGLLYEDGIFREVLPAGRHRIPRPPSALAAYFGARSPRIDVVLVDVRGRDRTVVVQELLTADGVTISASFVVQFLVQDPIAALHRVKSFEERLYADTQTAARRVLRGLSLDEVLAGRDEIGEETLRVLRESATGYGLDVTGLDFKDLAVPEDLRRLMNRAVLAKRLRQVEMAEGRSTAAIDDEPFVPKLQDEGAAESEAEAEDDPDLIIARADFGRDRPAEGRPEAPSIRPHAHDPGGNGWYASGFDVALRRCRP
jgi:regulator of protease activity HflC (stomatin/prohibitin superfamily)